MNHESPIKTLALSNPHVLFSFLKGPTSWAYKNELRNELFFNQPYLDPDDPKCTASDFFKEISYMINLSGINRYQLNFLIEIYEFQGTCYYHDEMLYCPILLKIIPEKVRQGYNGAQYLLQVWDMKKNKVYVKELQVKVKVWAVCYRYLVYTLEEGSEESQYVHIVDLENNNNELKIRNFAQDPMVKYLAYNNNVLTAATRNEIEAAWIPDSHFYNDGTVLEVDDLKIRKINPGLPIHAIFLNEYALEDGFRIVACETRDNQLDFNRLFFDNFEDDDSYGHRWTQYREIVPRKQDYQPDPIKKCCFIFSGGYNYSTVMRESGHFDLYWNMMKYESNDDKIVKDIEMSTNAFYFLMSDNNVYGFNHYGKFSASFTQAEPFSSDDVDWAHIGMKKVQNIVYIYTCFKVFSIYTGAQQKYFVTIGHGKYISIFNITDWEWINHMDFQDDIMHMFTHKTPDGQLYTSCVTKHGWIYVGFMYDGGKWATTVLEGWRTCHAEGTLVRLADDIENNLTLFVIHKEGNNNHLSMLYQKELQKIDEYLTGYDRLSVVCMQIRGENSYVVIQNDSKISLYQQKEKDGKFQLNLVKEFPDYPEITGTIHSATAYEIDKHFFIFDEKNMYVMNLSPASCTTYENIYCVGLQNFTKSYNYALCQDHPTATCPGLRLFDMESVIKRKKPGMTLLKNLDVGTQGFFEYSFNMIRIGLMKSFSHLAIIPILHRNVNKFMGMANTEDYLTYKVIKDTMMALTNTEGLLSSWNITTGKCVSRHIIPEYDYNGWTKSSKYKCGAVLIQSDDTVEAQDQEHFQPYQFEQNIENQTVFLKQGFHSYKRWKLIDIQDEKTVKTVLEYVHPSYSYQQVFFNKDKDRMIEVLQNYRTFFYKRVQQPGQPEHMVKWELIRRVNDYPTELEIDNGRLEFFTPCFSRYIVTDKKNKQFLIKDNYLDKVIYTIPKELMTFTETSKAIQTLNRCKWIDQSTLLITNEEGIEKLIDVDNNFQEIRYNYRPLFNEIDGKEWENHIYYVSRKDIEERDTLQRLKRVYQQYKTSYFLFNKRSTTELYQDLITVDTHKFNYNSNSFTFLHWSLVEQIQQGKMKVSELEEDVVQQIYYNIFPGGNSVFHKLADNETELIDLFKISHPDFTDPTPKFKIPFLPNIKGETAIHKCIEKEDYKSIDTILRYLKFYPTDHHSRGVKTAMGEMVDKELPELIPYLESRLQQTEQTKKITKGCIKEEHSGIIPCELWFKEEDFVNKLMRPKPIETRIKVEFLDLPGLYHYNDEEFHEVFENFAKTEMIEIFDQKAIKKLIDFNYPLVKEYIIQKLFIPFGIFMFFFVIFMHFVYPYVDRYDTAIYLFYPFLAVNLFFATYFVINEIKQLRNEGISYLLSFWNYIDLIPPIGIYLIAVMFVFETLLQKKVDIWIERSFLSIITFFMWFKFLYFFRIFEKTGYLIRMIIEVVIDMKYFFLLLFITIAAFGDSFLRISLGNVEQYDSDGAVVDNTSPFTYNFLDSVIFTYRMILGDFDTAAFGQVAVPLVMILWFLCTVFNMIVMLNLLIAIISDSYARVTGMSEQATYQERCRMIAENHYLIPDIKKKSYAEEGKYLLVVTNLEEEAKLDEDPIMEQLQSIKQKLDEELQDIKRNQIESDKHQEALSEKFELQQNAMKALRELIFLTLPQKEIKVTTHPHPLSFTIFEVLKKKNPDYATGWGCDGKQIKGCRGGKDYSNDDAEEYRYHCAECQFDYCEECYNYYGNTHEHDLQRLTHAEIMELHPGSYSSWGCDGRRNPSKCPQQDHHDNDIIYHDWENNYDLCEFCAHKYKEKDIQ